MSSNNLIDKIANVLMPEDDEPVKKEDVPVMTKTERPALKVYMNEAPALKVLVFEPSSFDQGNIIADHLKAKEAVFVNYEFIDVSEQQRLCDFVNGVCYILEGSIQRVSEYSVLYTPKNVDIDKELCSYSIPTYAQG